MSETITMTSSDQRRTIILTKLLVGELGVAEAAALMNLSERQVWRLRKAFQSDGPAALVHGNRSKGGVQAHPKRHCRAADSGAVTSALASVALTRRIGDKHP